MLNKLAPLFARLRKDEKGVTLVEYGIAIILAITLGGGALALLAGEIGASMGAAGTLMPGTYTAPTTTP